MTADGAEVVRAQRFELTDEKGVVRASLRVQSDGSLILALFDRDERHRAALGVSPQGSPGLFLYDHEGNTRAALVLGDGPGGAELQLRHEGGGLGVTMSLSADGETAGLALSDRYGTDLLALLMDSAVWGLTLRDRQGSTRAGLSQQTSGQASLVLADELGTPVWSSDWA